MNICLKAGFVTLIIMGMAVMPARGQYNVQHQAPTVVEKGHKVDLTFEAPQLNTTDILDAVLFYRMNDGPSYQQKQISFQQGAFKTSLQIPENAGTQLEYYLKVNLRGGRSFTYPGNRSLNGPVEVDIVAPNGKTNSTSSSDDTVDYTILSPSPQKTVAYNDVVIALSLFYDKKELGSSSQFHLFFDGKDVTKEADAGDYFLSYAPDQVSPGTHRVSLQVKNGKKSRQIVGWSFTAGSAQSYAQTDFTGTRQQARGISQGHVELRGRSQDIGGNATDIYSGNFRLSGGGENIRYSAYGKLTSQEDPRFQPQNRYGISFYAGDWLELQGGHIYPTLSDLTINGRRILGVNSEVHLFKHGINLQFLYGQLRRSINNRYAPVNRSIQAFNNGQADTTYTLNLNDPGTFQRDVIGGRLGFGRDKHFNFGINVLRVEDDSNSVKNISSYNDLLDMAPGRADGLSSTDKNKLSNDPGLLAVYGNPRPEGNLVTSTDLTLRFDDRRIQFKTNNALSLMNEDISRGSLTRQRAEDLGFNLDPDVENTLDQLSWLIIINENLSSLPFEYDDNGDLSNFVFPKSTLASRSELSLDYFHNNLRVQYRWMGPNFNSLANTTIRKDIAGVSIDDRFNLLENRLYVSLGYDNLRDNLADFKDATTQTRNYRGRLSWNPIRSTLPRISVGVQQRTRDNGVSLYNPFVPASQVDAAVRNFRQSSGNAQVAPRARASNTLQLSSSISQSFNVGDINNRLSLNYSWLKTTADKYQYGDAKSNSISLRLKNFFRSLPLTTNLGLNLNNTETSGGLNDIKIYGVDIGGSYHALENKLNLSASVAFTKNESDISSLNINENNTPTNGFDDYYEPSSTTLNTESNSYIFSAQGQYKITEHHAFAITGRFTNVTTTLSGNQIPNDHILQARYIFTF